jgi:hypothetical protein
MTCGLHTCRSRPAYVREHPVVSRRNPPTSAGGIILPYGNLPKLSTQRAFPSEKT